MSVATHRAALAALLRSVADVGIVHDEEPWARAEQAFRELYSWDAGDGTRQLRGWWLRRTRTAEQQLGVGRTLNVHTWTVRGFMALSPPNSGKAFDDVIEAVRRAYRADVQIGGAVDPGPLDRVSGFQVQDVTPVVLAGVLCHGATLQINTYEYLDAGE